jgi:aarF domain-containing kinase
MRRTALVLGTSLVGGGGYIAADGQRRQAFVRGVDFWSKALPVYTRYRLEEFLVRNKTDAEKAEAFDRLHKVYAPQCLKDILAMRGLYIKLGQMMTTRADYAPPLYLKELNVLQDSVPSRPFSAIAEDVRREMGVSDLKEVFQSIEEEPLGAATIGQVHGAVLLDGSRVVLKFQYPVSLLFFFSSHLISISCRKSSLCFAKISKPSHFSAKCCNRKCRR